MNTLLVGKSGNKQPSTDFLLYLIIIKMKESSVD